MYLACDELFKWHERSVEPLREWLKLDGFLLYAWVLPALLVTAVVGLLYARFLFHLPPVTRWRFLLAGTLFVGGAVGMEMVGGKVHEMAGYGTPAYAFVSHVEEVMEMSGVIVFVHALLAYAKSLSEPMRLAGRMICLTNAPSPAPAANPQGAV